MNRGTGVLSHARLGVFVGLAVVLAVVFVRLGLWQLDRLAERRDHNAIVRARLAEPVMPVDELPDSTMGPRRASLTGIPDYDNEFVITGRSRQGSPGVHILTPVRSEAGATVLVNRGWVYSPDAATVDLARWREARRSFSGYAQALAASAPAAQPAGAPRGRKLRVLTMPSVQALLPYPVAPLYLVVTDSAADNAPARLPPPEVSDGPHFNYAIQWFAFAAIAIVGAAIVVGRSKRQRIGSTGA